MSDEDHKILTARQIVMEANYEFRTFDTYETKMAALQVMATMRLVEEMEKFNRVNDLRRADEIGHPT